MITVKDTDLLPLVYQMQYISRAIISIFGEHM
jgi:hypothetical protein